MYYIKNYILLLLQIDDPLFPSFIVNYIFNFLQNRLRPKTRE